MRKKQQWLYAIANHGFALKTIVIFLRVHNGLSELPECHTMFHGEKVALGVLTGLFFADADKKMIHEVYSFCEAVTLPTTLEELGVVDITDEKLDIVAKRTMEDGESIFNELKPVSVPAIKAAILAADYEGRQRKGLV